MTHAVSHDHILEFCLCRHGSVATAVTALCLGTAERAVIQEPARCWVAGPRDFPALKSFLPFNNPTSCSLPPHHHFFSLTQTKITPTIPYSILHTHPSASLQLGYSVPHTALDRETSAQPTFTSSSFSAFDTPCALLSCLLRKAIITPPSWPPTSTDQPTRRRRRR